MAWCGKEDCKNDAARRRGHWVTGNTGGISCLECSRPYQRDGQLNKALARTLNKGICADCKDAGVPEEAPEWFTVPEKPEQKKRKQRLKQLGLGVPMNGVNQSKRKQRLKQLGMPMMNGVPVEMKERPNRQKGSTSRGIRRSLCVFRVWVRRSAHWRSASGLWMTRRADRREALRNWQSACGSWKRRWPNRMSASRLWSTRQRRRRHRREEQVPEVLEQQIKRHRQVNRFQQVPCDRSSAATCLERVTQGRQIPAASAKRKT